MQRYLLTPSLHDSFWYFANTEFKTVEEFMQTLRNERGEPSEPMLKGIKFEDDVLAYTQGKLDPSTVKPGWASCVKEVGDIVNGGEWQARMSQEIEICGMKFLLYGKADVIKRDWIYDIKFTGNYDIGKYTKKIQRLVYMYLAKMEKFAYLVTTGNDVFREDYFWQREDEALLFAELTEMVEYIMGHRPFREAFLEHWKCKY